MEGMEDERWRVQRGFPTGWEVEGTEGFPINRQYSGRCEVEGTEGFPNRVGDGGYRGFPNGQYRGRWEVEGMEGFPVS